MSLFLSNPPAPFSLQEEGACLPPDRLFKVVLVGNSSVGKTSLLRRFCDDLFYAGTAATVGQYTDTRISDHKRDTQTTPCTGLWPSS